MIARLLSRVPPEAIDVAEVSDPQFQAVRRIAARHGQATVAIVVANALVSYRLNVHGEDYWSRYAEWWSTRSTPGSAEELVEALRLFLSEMRVPLVEQKLGRLKRAENLLASLLADPAPYQDLRLLYRAALRVGRGGYQKTAAFAAKMAYYAYRILEAEVEGLSDIPVPLDKRFALLTATSGIIEAAPDEIYTRYRLAAEEAWRKIAAASGHPPARLDTLLWLPLRSLEPLIRKGLLGIARDEFVQKLLYYTGGRVDNRLARLLAEELLKYNTWVKRGSRD